MYVVVPLNSINYGATGKDAILQNAAFVLSSIIGTIPMDREKGLDLVVDLPGTEVTKTEVSSQIILALEEAVPEVTVEDIEFEELPLEGKLIPKVKVVINGE